MWKMATVATDVGGIREIVVDGESGILVPRGDPTLLADAIAGLLDDRPLVARLGAAARDHFTRAFDLGACAATYERLYAEAVQPPGGAGAEIA